jgi:nucleoid-associated protein YgaU
MQRIERYGVIALVFLLVTILAVSLWGEGKPGLKSSDRTAESARKGSAPISRAAPPTLGARDRALPTSSSALAVPGLVPETAGAAAHEALAANDAGPFEPRRRRGLAQEAGAEPASAEPPRPSLVETLPATVYVPPPETTRAPIAPGAPSATPATSSTAASALSRNEPKSIAAARTVAVRSGETLSEIAARELGSSKRWTEIAALNGGLDPTKLRAGMILAMPARDAGQAARVVAQATTPVPPAPAAVQPAAAKPSAAPAVAAGGRAYTVRAGDVLSSIAQRELGSARRWKEIAALNPGVDPGRLIVGSRLALPASAGSASSKAPEQVAAAIPAHKAGWGQGRAGSKVR